MKLKKKLALNYLVATLLALVFVGLAVIRGLQKLSITTMEQQLIDQSKLAEIYISQIHSLEGQEDPINLSSETANLVISKLGLIIGNVNIYDKNLTLQAASKGEQNLTIDEGLNEKVLSTALETGNYAYVIRDGRFILLHQLYEESTIDLEIIPYESHRRLITEYLSSCLLEQGSLPL